jgi:hypothetical protein
MTEAEWLACGEPGPMLGFMAVNTSPRKLRLFACACGRHVWELLEDERSRRGVEVLERFADGLVDASEVESVEREARAAAQAQPATSEGQDNVPDRQILAEAVAYTLLGSARTKEEYARIARDATFGFVLAMATGSDRYCPMKETNAQIHLLRELVGNPFRPVALGPASRTPTVTCLAQAAYDERIPPAGTLDPVRLAVVADALEEAGCMSEDILTHLRSAGPHVRGCWVLDLILGKEVEG